MNIKQIMVLYKAVHSILRLHVVNSATAALGFCTKVLHFLFEIKSQLYLGHSQPQNQNPPIFHTYGNP